MKKFLILAACAALLCGCTQSNIVQPTAETKYADPDFSTQEGIEIDWQQVSTDAEDIFEDEGNYEYSRDFHFYLEPNQKEIMLMWVVADDFPTSLTLSYAEDMIKIFNDVVSNQDFSIAKSDVNSYGGLWNQYSLSFSIVPENTQDDENTWFVSGTYPAGTEFALPNQSAIDSAGQMTGETQAAAETEAVTEAAQETQAAETAAQTEAAEAAAETAAETQAAPETGAPETAAPAE